LGGAKPKHKYVMSRRLICQCGYKIVSTNSKNGLYYSCPARRRRANYCRICAFLFSASKVDAVIWDWVKEFFENPELLRQGIARYQAQQENRVAPIRERVKAIEALIKEQEMDLNEKQSVLEDLKQRKASEPKPVS